MKKVVALMFVLGIAVLGVFAAGQEETGGYGEDPEASAPELPFEKIDNLLGVRGIPVIQMLRVPGYSLAAEIGLYPGDLIFAYNGQTMNEVPGFRPFVSGILKACEVGEVTFELLRYDYKAEEYVVEEIVAEVSTDDYYDGDRRPSFTSSFGYIVGEVLEDGPAERLGVQAGDFLQEINDHQVPNLDGPAGLAKLADDIRANDGGEISLRFGRWEYLDDGRLRGQFKEIVGSL